MTANSMKYDEKYDVCYVGGSIISLLYAHADAMSGKRVLVIEREGELGGAWRSATVFGQAGWENAPHFFSTTRARSYIRARFPKVELQQVPDNVHVAWKSSYPYLLKPQSELEFVAFCFVRGLIKAARKKSLRYALGVSRVFLENSVDGLKTKFYIKRGIQHLVSEVAKSIEEHGGLICMNESVLSIRETSESGPRQSMTIETDKGRRTCDHVALTRHSIIQEMLDQRFTHEDFYIRARKAIFMRISEAPLRPFYLFSTYNEAPFSFATNLSQIADPDSQRHEGTIVSAMVRSAGFLEDFAESAGHVEPAYETPEQAGDLAALLHARLIEHGFFAKSARIVEQEEHLINDSACKPETLNRFRELETSGKFTLLDTQDAGRVIADRLMVR